MIPSGGYMQVPADGVLHSPLEYEYARSRPYPERTPIPRVDDELFYRHNGGSPNTYRIQVTWVQSLEDMEDPNLWYFQTLPDGITPLIIEGQQVLARAKDPWPLIRGRLMEPTRDRGNNIDLSTGREIETREARMRMSAGWLPLDWETRPQPVPPSFLVVNG